MRNNDKKEKKSKNPSLAECFTHVWLVLMAFGIIMGIVNEMPIDWSGVFWDLVDGMLFILSVAGILFLAWFVLMVVRGFIQWFIFGD